MPASTAGFWVPDLRDVTSCDSMVYQRVKSVLLWVVLYSAAARLPLSRRHNTSYRYCWQAISEGTYF